MSRASCWWRAPNPPYTIVYAGLFGRHCKSALRESWLSSRVPRVISERVPPWGPLPFPLGCLTKRCVPATLHCTGLKSCLSPTPTDRLGSALGWAWARVYGPTANNPHTNQSDEAFKNFGPNGRRKTLCRWATVESKIENWSAIQNRELCPETLTASCNCKIDIQNFSLPLESIAFGCSKACSVTVSRFVTSSWF